MKDVSDVVVVGGGPCGSFAALKLAKLGADVTVFEEHSEIGIPSHCPGHLSIKGLKNLRLYPLPAEISENTFYGANFYSPKGNQFSVSFSSPVTCAVNRAIFDKHIAELAEKAGVNYCLNSRVEFPIVKDSFVKGVVVKQKGKTEKKLAKIVVDAEGISSRILKEAGLPGLNRHMLVRGVEVEVDNVRKMEPDKVEVFLGKEYARGFYAWMIPKNDGKAKVGLAAKNGDPRVFLQRLMLRHPIASRKLATAKILKISFHPITLGGPIPQAYSNGFLAVGDAASHVKPTTGGGVILGMICANVAAEVAIEALRGNDFSKESLSTYQSRCQEIWGFDAKVMLRLRRTLDRMSDERLDNMIGLCTRFGLDKTLTSAEDVDFQGQAFLRALRSPRMLTALSYFFLAYLSANL